MEKRSSATKQVQQEIEDYVNRGEMDAIKLKIDLFKKLTEDFSQAAYRRAGLYGLSAVGVALFQRNVSLSIILSFIAVQKKTQFLEQLINPIVNSFRDNDTKVQLAACDAIFNILKSYRELVLQNKDFTRIFEQVITLIAGSNQEVRDFAKKVDDRIKDTVLGCLNSK